MIPNIFLEDFRQQKRGVTEQVLNLSCTEKAKITALLAENLLPQNRAYKYDFLFDNCTTRLRDLLEKAADKKIEYPKVVANNTRFRELIHEYLDMGDNQWSKLGIDMLLGKKTDGIMSNREAMFLPDYLMKSFGKTVIDDHQLVGETIIVFKPEGSVVRNYFTSPFFIFMLLLAAIVVLGFSKNPSTHRTLNAFDGLLFFLVGMSGMMMLFMWFGTEHVMCKDNFNLLWAWPTHAIMAFFIHSRKRWVKKYFQLTLIVYILLLLAWFFIPQQLHPAFLMDRTFAGVAYRKIGNGPAVILVHGFGEDGNIWKNQEEILSEKYTLILPDIPGSGGQSDLLSEKDHPVQISDYAESIKEIIDEEKLESFILIGHSMGGYIALAFAEKYPGILKALGLFHSSAFADSEEKKATRTKAIEFIHEHGSEAFLKNKHSRIIC